MSLTRRVLIALTTGLAGGIAISYSHSPSLAALAVSIEPVGTLWVNAIRMTVIPLLVSLLIVSIASVADVGAIGRMGARALLLFLGLLGCSAFLAALVVPPLLEWFAIGAVPNATLRDGVAATAVGTAAGASPLPTVGQWFVDLVPTNPIRAAADGAMLPLLVFSLLFALASTRLTTDLRQLLLRFFEAVSQTMLILVRWIIALAPIGVFALMLALGARMGGSAVGALGSFVVVMCVLVMIETVALYPVAVLAGGVSLRRFARGVFPAQVVAFTTRSSLASLPALIQGADERLGLPPAVSGFVLPLAVSTFKVSAPIAWTVGTLFIARLYGVALAPSQVVLIAALAVIASFSAAGIPSGGYLAIAPLFASLGLPAEGIGILIALDLVPDLFKTINNVTADMTVATILARWAGLTAVAVPRMNDPAMAVAPVPMTGVATTPGALD
jgi:Na+/H+-dicarboxylate symporter